MEALVTDHIRQYAYISKFIPAPEWGNAYRNINGKSEFYKEAIIGLLCQVLKDQTHEAAVSTAEREFQCLFN